MLPIKPLYILLLFFPVFLTGQSDLHLKWEPKLAFSADINKRWSYNLQAGGLQFLDNVSQENEVQQTERIDVRGFISYSFFRKRKLSAGYMYRQTKPFEENPGFEHRLSALYSFQNYLKAWRLGHRFMTEYRIRNNGNQTRLRYRFSGDVPLQGSKLDEGEFYFLTADELVLTLTSRESTLENRFSFNFGRQMSQGLKLELGAEYRFRGSEEPDAIHLLSSVYYKL